MMPRATVINRRIVEFHEMVNGSPATAILKAGSFRIFDGGIPGEPNQGPTICKA
jgi:hypothetical protein